MEKKEKELDPTEKSKNKNILAALKNMHNYYEIQKPTLSVTFGPDTFKSDVLMREGNPKYDNSGHDTVVQSAKTLISHAYECMCREDYSSALADMNRAIALNPNLDYSFYTRGIIKKYLNDIEGAVEDFNKACQLAPQSFIYLRERGMAYYALNNYNKALEDLSVANGLNPNDTLIIKHIAELKYHNQDYKGALARVEEMLTENDKDTAALELKMKIQEAMEHEQHKIVFDDVVHNIPFEQIKIIEQIGEGGFGKVFLATWHDERIAVKILNPVQNADQTADLLKEIKFLKRLRHKNIVMFQGTSVKPNSNEIVMIMEYMKHGSLEDLIKDKKKKNERLSMPEIIRIGIDIGKGLRYLHHHTPKVIHRDLKSANVLLYQNKTRAKIADFGTARFLNQHSAASTVLGTFGAIAPEILAEEPYDEKVDIFSFGVLLYEMITSVKLGMLEEKIRFKRIDENVSEPEFNKLIKQCCSTDPKERPTISECIMQLKTMNLKL